MKAKILIASAALLFATSAAHANNQDTDDRTFTNTFQVYKGTDDGSPGTLRWAILQANQSPGLDKIVIAARSNRPLVIQANSLLPTLQGPLVIEGDRDWSPDSGDRRHADDGPDVVIDGSKFIDASTIQSCPAVNPNQFGPNARTFTNPGLAIVDTGDVEISGVEVRNFCIGILVLRSKNNFIHDNRLFNNIGGAGVMFTGDDGSGGSTSGLTVNNIAAHNEFVDNGDGLELTRGSNQNLVADNTFTMTPNGLTPSQGIETINSNENRIVRNKFSNFSDGIQMNGGNRNYIGENEFTGNSNGITLSGDGHVVERNVIHGNRLGIRPSAGNHTLTENSIYGNGQDIFLCNAGGTGGTPPACNLNYPQLGIDLAGDGMTPNDLAADCADGFPDCDTGPNGLQNFPVLNPPSAASSGLLVLTGSLASRPNQTYVIELFANRSPGVVEGYGEGELFVGAARVATDASGNATFSVPLDPNDVVDRLMRKGSSKDRGREYGNHKGPIEAFFTATATDASAGATSEFSQAVRVLLFSGK
jgi:3-dehydroshikimate dehydratase